MFISTTRRQVVRRITLLVLVALRAGATLALVLVVSMQLPALYPSAPMPLPTFPPSDPMLPADYWPV